MPTNLKKTNVVVVGVGAVGGVAVLVPRSWRNPTLTAQALAWRTAEHLVNHWKTIAS